MFSLEIDRRRHRITFNGVEFWLVRLPQRVKKGEKEFNGQQSTG
jgi:hypothetical protein